MVPEDKVAEYEDVPNSHRTASFRESSFKTGSAKGMALPNKLLNVLNVGPGSHARNAAGVVPEDKVAEYEDVPNKRRSTSFREGSFKTGSAKGMALPNKSLNVLNVGPGSHARNAAGVVPEDKVAEYEDVPNSHRTASFREGSFKTGSAKGMALPFQTMCMTFRHPPPPHPTQPLLYPTPS